MIQTEFQLPAGFDNLAYSEVDRLARQIADPNSGDLRKKNAWMGYASAWHGVAVRLRSAVEFGQEFSQWITTGTGYEGRYREERALYACVTAALSAVECFYMATYCLGSALAPAAIKLEKAKHLNQSPIDVAAAFEAWQPLDSYTRSLKEVVASAEFKDLSDLRNTLAHRGVIPRQHLIRNAIAMPSKIPSNPKALAEELLFTVELTPSTTAKHAGWILTTTSRLTGEFCSFLKAKI